MQIGIEMTSSPEDNNQSGVLMPELFEKCPQCYGDGWYVQPNYHTGDAEQAQCEYCLASGYIPHTRAEPAKPLPAGLESEALEELNALFYYECPFWVSALKNPRLSDKSMHTIRAALTHTEAAAVVDLEELKREVRVLVSSHYQHGGRPNKDKSIGVVIVDYLAAKYPHIFKSSAQRGE